MTTTLIKSLAIALLLTTGAHCFAGEEMLEIDTRFRAKIMKEKLKQAARDRADEASGKDTNDGSQCGSQNIGNVDTGGRPGSGPREVFVFAPNAINIVGRGGCR